MTNYLQIDWHPDDGFTDDIYVEVESEGFSAKAGAYYAHRETLADFGKQLERYPIAKGEEPELLIAYGRPGQNSKKVVFDIPMFRVRIEPVDRLGALIASVLVRDRDGGQMAELRMKTSYGALQTFREQLRAAEGAPTHGTARLE